MNSTILQQFLFFFQPNVDKKDRLPKLLELLKICCDERVPEGSLPWPFAENYEAARET
jgi:hypothetical protein